MKSEMALKREPTFIEKVISDLEHVPSKKVINPYEPQQKVQQVFQAQTLAKTGPSPEVGFNGR